MLQRGAFVSEPAILVRRMISGSQVWSMEKLENKLIDMREMYQEHKDRPLMVIAIAYMFIKTEITYFFLSHSHTILTNLILLSNNIMENFWVFHKLTIFLCYHFY